MGTLLGIDEHGLSGGKNSPPGWRLDGQNDRQRARKNHSRGLPSPPRQRRLLRRRGRQGPRRRRRSGRPGAGLRGVEEEPRVREVARGDTTFEVVRRVTPRGKSFRSEPVLDGKSLISLR